MILRVGDPPMRSVIEIGLDRHGLVWLIDHLPPTDEFTVELVEALSALDAKDSE